MEEALFLTRFATQVTVIHRRDAFRASKIMVQRVLENPKIKVRWNAVVAGLVDPAQGKLTALRLRDVKTNAESLLDVGALFVAIGLVPASKPFAGVLETDENGYLLSRGVRTKLPGVFVAGDVADSRYRQAVTAAGVDVHLHGALCGLPSRVQDQIGARRHLVVRRAQQPAAGRLKQLRESRYPGLHDGHARRHRFDHIQAKGLPVSRGHREH
jgi:pyruvate/2-oxoglutarate dehydrogenase complex dihydrolipoamide dehydrogenase (E3) component